MYTAFEAETVDDRIDWVVGDEILDIDRNDSQAYVQKLYEELRATVLTEEQLEEMILQLDHQVRASGAFGRDRERWPKSVHADSVEQLLNYATKRLEFLDKALYDIEYYDT